jgi:hypothetical protein
MSGMEAPGFNAAVWKKSVEARFRDDYTERQEQTIKATTVNRIELVPLTPADAE